MPERIADNLGLSDKTVHRIGAIAGRYMWWPAISGREHPVIRLLAQLMRYGTYDDIREVEGMVSPQILLHVLRHAEPGWFDRRSWGFWRGRLAAHGAEQVGLKPPQRGFAHAGPV